MAFIENEFHLTIRDINDKTELTNKAILSFFEDIGGYHSDLAGYGLKDIERTKLSWVLLHWKVQVLKRVKYGECPTLKVKTWSRGSKLACCLRDYEIYDSNGELCVVATSKWALIHLEKGLMKLTDEILDKYTTETKTYFSDFDFKKLQEPTSFSNTYSYTVSRRDLDINNHMHNLNYLDLAYETLPENVYKNNDFKNFEIMYKNGAFLNSKLKCFYSEVENKHFVTIKSEDLKTLHCIIKLY